MIQRALACLGLAFLLMAHPFVDLLESQAMIRYHSASPLAPLVIALWIDLVVLAVAFLLVTVLLEKAGLTRWLRLVAAAWIPLLFVRRICLLWGHPLASRLMQWLTIAMIVMLIYLWRKRPTLYEGYVHVGAMSLACFGGTTVLLALQLIPLARWYPAQPIATHNSSLRTSAQPHGRIVWIVLDELSYEQAFGRRLPGLNLPALDALSRQSVNYPMVQPVGDKTDRVLPSLLTGQTVSDINYTWSNRLLLQLPESPAWVPFQAGHTPFALAKQRGWHTGVVGWYNPYCSLLKPYLDDCYWSNEGMDKAAWNLADGQGAVSGAMTGLRALLGSRTSKYAILTETARTRLHLLSEQQVYAHALTLASNDGIDLMLLHLPVPHFPNVYDRRTGQASLTNRSYADNLALADKDLGGLMAVLQRSPRWSDTTVIVCGDHSWRTTWWQPTPYWTAEDERMSQGGKFDPRPVLLVHAAGQTQGVVNREAISLLEVHRLLVRLITSGSVQATAQMPR
jgi:hypothetical protein